jgi:hypothetical protein
VTTLDEVRADLVVSIETAFVTSGLAPELYPAGGLRSRAG